MKTLPSTSAAILKSKEVYSLTHFCCICRMSSFYLVQQVVFVVSVVLSGCREGFHIAVSVVFRTTDTTDTTDTTIWKAGLMSIRAEGIILLIRKITISSVVIGWKNSYFPLIYSPSCYRTACYRKVQQTNQIQSCSLNQPNHNLSFNRHRNSVQTPKFMRPLSVFWCNFSSCHKAWLFFFSRKL